MRINHKMLLILALASVQAVALTWAVMLFDSWLGTSMRDIVRQQVLSENTETAKQMARLIQEMDVQDPRTDLPSWDRLQEVVRDINLPNEGFVCLVDADGGGVLCHPSFGQHPTIGSKPMMKRDWKGEASASDAHAKTAAASDTVADQVAGDASGMSNTAMAKKPPMETSAVEPVRGGTTSGIYDTANGVQIIAATELPGIQAKLLVHQHGRGIDQAVARIMAPVRPLGLAVSLGLVVVTTMAVIAIVHGYESKLASINRHLEQLVAQRTRSLMKTRDGLIFGLAKLAESRDTDTGEHLDRIAKYVTILAEQLREDGLPFTTEDIHDLALASSLHDIGKVGVPDAVLLKPGRLDPEERIIIETHATIGGDCLQALSDQLGEDDFLQVAEEIAYGHHERWDGGGYPFQRAGEQIPLSARIVAVADVYDALRSKRPYKEGMSHEKAKNILVEDSGSHFDPLVIEAFLAAEDRFQAVAPETTKAAVEPSAELAPA